MIEYKQSDFYGKIIEADGKMMQDHEILFALREGEALKKENASLEAEIEQLKKTSIKIGKGSKVGNIRIGKRGGE